MARLRNKWETMHYWNIFVLIFILPPCLFRWCWIAFNDRLFKIISILVIEYCQVSIYDNLIIIFRIQIVVKLEFLYYVSSLEPLKAFSIPVIFKIWINTPYIFPIVRPSTKVYNLYFGAFNSPCSLFLIVECLRMSWCPYFWDQTEFFFFSYYCWTPCQFSIRIYGICLVIKYTV